MQSITNPSHVHATNILRGKQMLSDKDVQGDEVSGILVYSPEGGGLGRLGSPSKPFGGEKSRTLNPPFGGDKSHTLNPAFGARDLEEGSMRKAEGHEDSLTIEQKTNEISI